MKGIYIISVALIFFMMVMLPLLSMKKTEVKRPEQSTSEQSIPQNDTVFRMYMTKTGKVEEVTAFRYVCGVVAAEMSAENEKEALKAQAVVAYTYALYKAQQRKDEEYDITDSHKTDQEYYSKEEMRENFGDSYDEYSKKIEAAVGSVLGQVIVYDKKPILAVCHSISGGRTEKASDIWGGVYPYLQPVESVGDVLSPRYLSNVSVSVEDMRKAMVALNIKPSDDIKDWIGATIRSDSGSVLKIMLCKQEVKGSDVRTALGLRSANFDVAYSEGVFNFTVRGYGHGVGMSQYGAQFMALQGSTYKEILLWYYTDCEITKI